MSNNIYNIYRMLTLGVPVYVDSATSTIVIWTESTGAFRVMREEVTGRFECMHTFYRANCTKGTASASAIVFAERSLESEKSNQFWAIQKKA